MFSRTGRPPPRRWRRLFSLLIKSPIDSTSEVSIAGLLLVWFSVVEPHWSQSVGLGSVSRSESHDTFCSLQASAAISSPANGYPADRLDEALQDVEVVVIPAGVPRKPCFLDSPSTNASIVRDLATAIARNAPKAHILVISNPVNSTVPI
ncbi:hypothetical protein M422DRAFT_272711, partial [Sphaerobolus stellatus SS14]